MDCIIRKMQKDEYCLLSDFLYEAIYIPDGTAAPPKSVIACPEVCKYILQTSETANTIRLWLQKLAGIL